MRFMIANLPIDLRESYYLLRCTNLMRHWTSLDRDLSIVFGHEFCNYFVLYHTYVLNFGSKITVISQSSFCSGKFTIPHIYCSSLKSYNIIMIPNYVIY